MRIVYPSLGLPIVAITILFCQFATAQNTSPYWSLSGNSNATTSSKLGTTTAIPLRLYTKNAERLRIDTSGRVGIGLTTLKGKLTVRNLGSIPAASWISVAPVFAGYSENSAGSADYVLSMASNVYNARSVLLGKRSRGTLAVPARVSNNDLLVSMMGAGFDGSTFQYPATLDFVVDGTSAAGAVPTRISFTTGSNATNRAERLRLSSNGNISLNGNQLFVQKTTGNVGIGTTTPAYKLEVTGTRGMSVENVANTTDATGIRTGASGYGIFASAYGVLDEDNGFRGGGIAVYGKSFGTYGAGVRGEVSDDYGTGVQGIGGAQDGAGVVGQGKTGVVGQSSTIDGIGVQGDAFEAGGIGVRGSSVNSIGIYGTTANSSSYAGYFNGSVYSTGSYLPSARKLKQHITDLNSALAILSKLRPKAYEYKQEGMYNLMHLPKGKRYGLIAEELEAVLPDLVNDVSFDTRLAASVKQQPGKAAVQKAAALPSETIDFKAVNYIELIPIMVKGMQEQQEENNALKAQLADQQQQIEDLRQLVLRLGTDNAGAVTVAASYLEQNHPNPASGTTTIRYYISNTARAASLIFTNTKGQTIKTIRLVKTGSGLVTLTGSTLAAGTYNYSLAIDGKIADTKKLIILP